MKTTKILLLSILSMILLSGCSQSDDSLDLLKKEIESKKANAVAFIPEIPKIKTFSKYTYKSGGLKSPFTKTRSEVITEKKITSEVQPDLKRKKEDLEKFELNDFKMIGTIQKRSDKSIQAVISVDNGKVFIIDKGDYIGKNNGKITNITDSEISLNEIIQNGPYIWIKRPSTIKMIKTE